MHALRGADFVLHAGEVHALLGENGAGKTTLMHVAYGLARPDAGGIERAGRPVTIGSPAAARRLGIGMVHQHFTSVPAFTVAENVALATGGRAPAVPAPGDPVLAALWEGLDPEAVVERLPVGLRQRLEVVKALAAKTEILLLDEPSAVLTPQEITGLMSAIRDFAARGGAAVLITHKLSEALAVADRVTVLRHGTAVRSGPVGAETRETLATAMLGEAPAAEPPARPRTPGEERVRLTGVTVAPLEGRGPGLRGADLSIRAGEIVGVAAVEGNGHRELMLGAAGLLQPAAGTVAVRGRVALVPEDRTTEGLIPGLSLTENVVLGRGTDAPWIRGAWLDWGAARVATAAMLPAFAIAAPGPDEPAATLSGGNQQKLLLARALAEHPEVLVAENPTRGLDIRATAAIRARLRDAAADGVAVLLYSSDLDEVLALADRVVVVTGGELRPMPPGATRDRVGSAMLGVAESGR